MGALPADDLKDIDKPLSYREMFKKILDMIEADREDRTEDREMLEKFVTTQADFNKAIDQRVRSLEGCVKVQDEAIDTLKKSSRIIDAVIGIGAFIGTMLGLKGS